MLISKRWQFNKVTKALKNSEFRLNFSCFNGDIIWGLAWAHFLTFALSFAHSLWGVIQVLSHMVDHVALPDRPEPALIAAQNLVGASRLLIYHKTLWVANLALINWAGLGLIAGFSNCFPKRNIFLAFRWSFGQGHSNFDLRSLYRAPVLGFDIDLSLKALRLLVETAAGRVRIYGGVWIRVVCKLVALGCHVLHGFMKIFGFLLLWLLQR